MGRSGGPLSRRRLLAASATLVAAAPLAGPPLAGPSIGWRASAQVDGDRIELRTPVGPPGFYVYLPFEVPAGVNRIDGRIIDKGGATVGLGLFDQRGPQHQSPGFRGVFGGELAEFSVAADRASRSFIPGTIEPGTWTVFVPVFQPAPNPTAELVIEIVLHRGDQPPALSFAAVDLVVRDTAGWYRGDLHCHTPESSDAWGSGTAMTPAQWAQECRRVGLDFASMTDHNAVSQNLWLPRDMATADDEVLLIGGEEMTNWFHGHATVTGLEPGEWLDWRSRPAGVPLQDHEARITEFVATAREMGVFTSAAHPLGPGVGLPWTFILEGQADPAAIPDGLEVWTGDLQPDDQASIAIWETLLLQGRRVVANGGSDLHGTVNATQPAAAGTPTTVVWAEMLSVEGIVAGLKAGRCFITRAPNGGEVYLTATGPGGQRTFTGGTIVGAPTDTVEVQALVRRGSLLADAAAVALVLIVNGVPALTQPIAGQEATVSLTVPVGAGGYVRAELQAEPELVPDNPTGSRMGTEVITNPIWFTVDGEPLAGDGVEEEAPPPESTPRRLRGHQALLDPGVAR